MSATGSLNLLGRSGRLNSGRLAAAAEFWED